jgi:hypothetical protein
MNRMKSLILSFLTLGIAVSTIQVNGGMVDYQTLIAFLKTPTFDAPPSFNTLTGPLAVAQTNASATPGTVRDIYGQMVTGVSLTSGNLVGVRGEVNITNGTTVGNGVFLYGLQGKVIGGTSTLNTGSAHVTGVLGSLDLTGTTNTSGHINAVTATIQGVGSSGAKVNLFYGESATGTEINSMFQAFGKSKYVFDLESNVHTQMSTTGTPGSVTGGTGWLKVLVEGVVRYIPLASSVS